MSSKEGSGVSTSNPSLGNYAGTGDASERKLMSLSSRSNTGGSAPSFENPTMFTAMT